MNGVLSVHLHLTRTIKERSIEHSLAGYLPVAVAHEERQCGHLADHRFRAAELRGASPSSSSMAAMSPSVPFDCVPLNLITVEDLQLATPATQWD